MPLADDQLVALDPMRVLSSGRRMPVIGLGTAHLLERQVLSALRAGVRHLDCARMYGNEEAVGRAIRASGVPRAELFVTSKLYNDEHAPADVAASCRAALAALQLDKLDLFLVHWPLAWRRGTLFVAPDAGVTIAATWRAMEGLVDAGLVDSIGVSNFDAAQVL